MLLRIAQWMLLLALVLARPGQAEENRLWLVPAGVDLPPDVQVLGWAGSRGHLVRARRQQLAGLPVAPYAGKSKLSPELDQRLQEKAAGPVALEIVLARGEDAAGVVATLTRLEPAAEVLRIAPGPPDRIIVRVDADRAVALTDRLGRSNRVTRLQRHWPMGWLNQDSVGPIQANAPSGGPPPTATPIWDQDILGTGQVVGIADSGLDRNEGWFRQLHNGVSVNTEITDAADTTPPIPGPWHNGRKVAGYWVMPGASAYDDNENCDGGVQFTSFHGTHVTGTAAGDGGTPSRPDAANYDPGDGMAPQAQILFQDLGNDSSGCLSGAGGVPMWSQALAAGVRIHSNSYGSRYVGQYQAREAALDEFLWRNEDMLLVFAAGNEGSGGISHPGHAKHPLTVGALLHGNSTVPAGFSSLGPTSDGRIKPDLAAPGSLISSARGNDEDSVPSPGITGLFSGTSMAAPAVAGAAALVSQYFDDGFYPTGVANPDDALRASGPLLKAVLLNGTLTFADTPGFDRGWGRVWLDNNLYFAGDDRQLRVWSLANDAGLSQGEFHEFQLQVPAGGEFRATLVWYDPAPLLAAPEALVNDLDLSVTAPDGTYLGNRFSGGVSSTGGSPDQLNPVEQVRFESAQAGVYTVRVDAGTVPGTGLPESLRQGYALVVSSGQCDSAVVDAPDFSLVADPAEVQRSVSGAPGAYQVYRAPGSCAGLAGAPGFVGVTATGQFDDTTTQGGFQYAYQVRGVDACGEGPASVCRDVVSQAPCTLTPQGLGGSSQSQPLGSFCATRVSWPEAAAQCPDAGLGYELHRSTDPFFAPDSGTRIADGLPSASYTDLQAASGVTHYYRSVAVDSRGNRAAPTHPVLFAAVGPVVAPGTFQDGGESLATMVPEFPWRLTASHAAEGARSYRQAEDGLSYQPDTCAAISTPDMPLQAGAVLSYQARFELESGWDGVVVEVSTDGGRSWTDLPPNGGYPGDFSQTEPTGSGPVNACGYPATQGAFSGDSGGAFQSFQSDLSSLAGETVRFRWRFSSDPGMEMEGFYLDAISVTQAGVPSACIDGELLWFDGFE